MLLVIFFLCCAFVGGAAFTVFFFFGWVVVLLLFLVILGLCCFSSSCLVGAARFLLWVVLFRALAFVSSWELTIVEGQGRVEVRIWSLWCRWFLGCCWYYVSCCLGLWALALSLSLTFAMVSFFE